MLTHAFIAGAIAMASLTAALFFLRFWKSTHDRFFLYFAISFALETVSRMLHLASHTSANDPLIYLIRLVAYGLILVAIVEKNRRPAKPKSK